MKNSQKISWMLSITTVLFFIFCFALSTPAKAGDRLADIGLDSTSRTAISGGSCFASDAAIDVSGNIYILDQNPGYAVKKLSPDGTLLSTIRAPIWGRWNPLGSIAIDGSGNIFVAAFQTFYKFTPDGTNVISFGGHGEGEDKIQYGTNLPRIMSDRENNIVVADGCRLKRFDSSGTYLPRSLIDLCSITENNYIHAFAFDSGDNIYVSYFTGEDIREAMPEGGYWHTPVYSNVKKFSPDLTLLATFDSWADTIAIDNVLGLVYLQYSVYVPSERESKGETIKYDGSGRRLGTYEMPLGSSWGAGELSVRTDHSGNVFFVDKPVCEVVKYRKTPTGPTLSRVPASQIKPLPVPVKIPPRAMPR